MIRKLVCIICPRGCSLIAEMNDNEVTVVGNACPKGVQYAKDECLHPLRTVTSGMRVANREDRLVSVKTAAPIPKEKIFEVMERIRATEVTAPVAIGDVLLEDVFGTQVIATKAVE